MNPLPLNLQPWLRRAAIALGTVLALWVLGWLVVPPLLKSQVESRGSEALGRKLSIGSIDFKPWTMELTVSDLAIATADGAARQLGIARIYVDAEMESLFRLAPVLDAITIEAPTVLLTHKGDGSYDIDDIVKRLSAPAEQPSAGPTRFALYNVTLTDGSVDFVDEGVGKPGKTAARHTVRKLRFGLPFLSNLESKRDIRVEPLLAFDLNGSSFDSGGQGTPFAQVKKGDATLTLAGFDLKPYLAYLPASLPVQIKGAVLDAKVGIKFEQDTRAQVILSGNVSVSNLKVVDRKGVEMLGVESIKAELRDVRPLEQVVKLASIEITAPKVRALRDRNGSINLVLPAGKSASDATKKVADKPASTRASAPKDAKVAAKAVAWAFELDRFSLHKGEVSWQDDTLTQQAKMGINEMELAVKDVRWPFGESAASFEGSLAVASKAKPARLVFEGTGSDKAGKAHAKLSDAALSLAAPYAAQYLEPGVAGQLDGDVDVVWGADALQLVVNRFAVSDFALQAGKGKAPAANATSAERAAAELPRFKLFEVSAAQVDWMAQSARIGKVTLSGANVMAHRTAQGQWMFERWLKGSPRAADQPASAGTAAPVTSAAPTASAAPLKPAAAPAAKAQPAWKVALDEVGVVDSVFSLDDRSKAKPVRLELSGVKVLGKGLTLDGKKPAALQVAAKVRSGRTESGALGFKGTVMWDPLAVEGALDVSDLPAHAVAPYAADRLNVELLRADASFKGQVRYAAKPAGAEVQVRGDAALAEFAANSGTEELLRWKTLSVPGIDFAMAPGAATQLAVREAALSDFYARIVVDRTGRINLQDLVKPAPADTPPEAQAPDAVMKFGPIGLVNGRVLFTDYFIQPNYTANLSALTGRLSQFASQTTGSAVQLADLDIRGRAEGTASLEITGKVNPLAKPLALDINGRVRDLELPPLSPYAIKYAGYGIERGKLSVDVNYTVKPDGELTASNNIVLNQLSFGEKVEGAPNSLPVKLAVALLADRNGVIDLNLPISGSLNDPQFKLGPVIWKIITNLVVKAITSPFSLLAGAFGGGGGGDELSAVNFAPGVAVLDDAAMKGLDKIAKALADRPALAMTVAGAASLEVEREALKAQRLKGMLLAEKRRRALTGGQDANAVTAVEPAESAALLKAVYRRADITKPRNMVGLTKDLPDAEMEGLLMASISVNEDAMRELALQRGVAVKDYLASRKLPLDRLFLGAVKLVKPDAAAEGAWKPKAELSLTSR